MILDPDLTVEVDLGRIEDWFLGGYIGNNKPAVLGSRSSPGGENKKASGKTN